jgi:ATP-dependent Lon protease
MADLNARVPVLPLRDAVIPAGFSAHLFVTELSGIAAIDAAVARDAMVFLVLQKPGTPAEPGPADLHSVGTLARVVEHASTLPDAMRKVTVAALKRASLVRARRVTSKAADMLEAEVTSLGEGIQLMGAGKGLMYRLADEFERYAARKAVVHGAPGERKLNVHDFHAVRESGDPVQLVNYVTWTIDLGAEQKQQVLALERTTDRVARMIELIEERMRQISDGALALGSARTALETLETTLAQHKSATGALREEDAKRTSMRVEEALQEARTAIAQLLATIR